VEDGGGTLDKCPFRPVAPGVSIDVGLSFDVGLSIDVGLKTETRALARWSVEIPGLHLA
jgi:hypothetical protein